MKDRNYVTPELTRRLDNLRDECTALHLVNPPISFLTLDVTEPDGSTWRHHQKTHSWVMNYYRFLGASFLNASFSAAGNGTIVDDEHFNMKDTVNGAIIAAPTVRYTNISGEIAIGLGSYNATAALSGIRAGVVNMRSGVTNINNAAGIVIGSSADTSKNHNYDALVEPIYNISNTPVPNTASDKTSPVFDSNNGTWTRTLNNQFTNSNAGSGITINEVGMIADYVSFWASADSYVAKYSSTRMLLDRTVLEAPVILNLSASVIITYTIQFSWPRALNN